LLRRARASERIRRTQRRTPGGDARRMAGQLRGRASGVRRLLRASEHLPLPAAPGRGRGRDRCERPGGALRGDARATHPLALTRRPVPPRAAAWSSPVEWITFGLRVLTLALFVGYEVGERWKQRKMGLEVE